jgi:digeranylgeranylglycerophospholipid reductase
MAGLPAPTKLNPAIFCIAEGPFYSDTIDVYFGDVAPGGYAWVIPKNGTANIGIGFPHEYRDKTMRQRLNHFLLRFPDVHIRFVSGGSIPLGGRVHPLVCGQRLAVGDAAGMVTASNGGGILPALINGQIAGLSIADHLLRGLPLIEYERCIKEVMGTQLEIARRRKIIFDVLYRYTLRHNRIFEAFFLLGGTHLIEKAIRISPLVEGKHWFVPAWAANLLNTLV